MDTNSTDPTPFSTPIRSPEPIPHDLETTVANTPTNSISDETDCDNSLRNKDIQEEDDVVCANEHVHDAQSDASTSQNTASEATDQAEQNEITNTSESVENSNDNDEVDGETAPTDNQEILTQEVIADETETQNETQTQNETEDIQNETENTQNGSDATENETEVPQTEVVVEDALTFDENHFSTPTGASPVTSPVSRRRRSTTSSLEDSEVRQHGRVRAAMRLYATAG